MRISDWSSDVCSSDLEIVTVVAGKSNDYDDVALVWASVIAFLAMSIVALFPEFYRGLYDRLTGGWGHELTANQWLGMVIAFGVLKWIGVWLILLWRPLRMALTPRSIRATRVRARAVDLFKVGTEGKTTGRTGEIGRAHDNTSELQSLMRISYAVFY